MVPMSLATYSQDCTIQCFCWPTMWVQTSKSGNGSDMSVGCHESWRQGGLMLLNYHAPSLLRQP